MGRPRFAAHPLLTVATSVNRRAVVLYSERVLDDLWNVDLGDQIRLRAAFGGLPAGSEGVVFGFYRHPDEPAIAVRFGDVRLTVPLELCEIVGSTSLRQSG